MHNFRETNEKDNCTKCRYFYSYQDFYHDELEPNDVGICSNIKDVVSEEYVCNKFKIWENNN
jgi:hypothetical protein